MTFLLFTWCFAFSIFLSFFHSLYFAPFMEKNFPHLLPHVFPSDLYKHNLPALLTAYNYIHTWNRIAHLLDWLSIGILIFDQKCLFRCIWLYEMRVLVFRMSRTIIIIAWKLVLKRVYPHMYYVIHHIIRVYQHNNNDSMKKRMAFKQ